jgi:hypothetical protein
MLNAVTDIHEDTVVEVVISAQTLGEDDVEIRPHQLSIHSYKTPTFCHFCGEMLFGMFKQASSHFQVIFLRDIIVAGFQLRKGDVPVFIPPPT